MKQWMALLIAVVLGMVVASRCSIQSYDGYEHPAGLELASLNVVRSMIADKTVNLALSMNPTTQAPEVVKDILRAYKWGLDQGADEVVIVFVANDVRPDRKWVEQARMGLEAKYIDILLADPPRLLEDLFDYHDEVGGQTDDKGGFLELFLEEPPLFEGF